MNTEIEAEQEYMLEKYTELTAIDVYDKGRVREIVDAIEKEALSFALTPDTNKGRSEIASLAHKVARSKTFLDNLGKDRVAEWKEKAKKVDAERKLLRDRLDELKDKVRQPLTEWEQKEQARKDRIAEDLKRIQLHATDGFDPLQGPAGYPSIEDLENRLTVMETFDLEGFDEYKDTANQYIAEVSEKLRVALAARRDYDKQQAELARLKKEEEERQAKEAEERRIREEKERKEREEREAKEREARIREEEQKRAQEAAERAKREAEQKLKEAEEARIRAEERAKAEKEEAIRRERERVEAEKRKEAEEQAKREANKRHRNKILKEAREDLENATEQDGATAEMVLKAIEAGKIRHVNLIF